MINQLHTRRDIYLVSIQGQQKTLQTGDKISPTLQLIERLTRYITQTSLPVDYGQSKNYFSLSSLSNKSIFKMYRLWQ